MRQEIKQTESTDNNITEPMSLPPRSNRYEYFATFVLDVSLSFKNSYMLDTTKILP